MPRKKIIREPVEKLSSDAIVEITSDSSSDEEDNVPMIKPVKKPRTAKQLLNDQRLRDSTKKKVIEPVNELDSTTHPVKPVPVADVDPDDKPMTARQMKAYMSQMNTKPVVKKPRKPRATKEEMATRKSEKNVKESTLTPPPLVRTKPELLFV